MARMDRLRTFLTPQQLDAIIITQPENRTYLTGFTGSAGAALVTAREALLLVDFRYVEQAAAEAPDWDVIRVPRQATDALGELVRRKELQRIGFEPNGVTYHEHVQVAAAVQPATLLPVDGIDR